jgi:60 kDa SS-A/Ro ribonucleoprotein
MPMTAMVRNLGTMSKVGLLTPLSEAARHVVAQLGDVERLRKARVHPIGVLLALKTYAAGHGYRGIGTWMPVGQVADALHEAFYATFQNVVPSGKRLVLAIDVSGSMAGSEIAGTHLMAREAAAAMALVTARTEPAHTIMAFGNEFVPLPITPKQRLDDVVKMTEQLGMTATDCALPMLWALGEEYRGVDRHGPQYQPKLKGRKAVVEADAFLIYTDSETWYGDIHPVQALQRYREWTGIAAKLIVVAMTATECSIADPQDSGMLDVVGFDAAAPVVVNDFLRGAS